MNWSIEQLKRELSGRAEIKSWTITQEHVRRRERYFLSEAPGAHASAVAVDQDRDVSSQAISVRLAVRKQDPARQGEVTQKLFPALPLAPQIDAAIASAAETDLQAWDLPTSLPANLPQLKTTDPRMAEDLDGALQQLTTRIIEAASRPRDSVFNSAELFLAVHDRELHLANGLVHRASQSRVYAEAAFSYAEAGRSDEYLSTRWAVSLDDLPIEELFEQTADHARRSLDVRKPDPGKYAVLVDADVLSALFNDQLAQLSGVSSYNGLPFVAPGSELVAGGTADPLTIHLDPGLEYGCDSSAVSEQGIAQKKLTLVRDNRVEATLLDQQYGQYLGKSPTTVRGDVAVECGPLGRQELLKQAPAVLEILQFSGLFTDANSGTFASEIRLARLHDAKTGKTTYIKGGSLSGAFGENFKGARFSKERARRALFPGSIGGGHGYDGPAYALLTNVSVVS